LITGDGFAEENLPNVVKKNFTMNFEFDNEMDAILRKTRGVTDFAAVGDHLDADEIAAFAENALSESARTRLTMHFADCARCRMILANTFSADTEEPVAVVAATPDRAMPWYRALFRAPQLAFGLGALVLAFSGFVGYVLLRNSGNTGDVAATNRGEIRSDSAPQAPANSPVAAANAPAMNAAPASATPAANAPVAAADSAPKGLGETADPSKPVAPSSNSAVTVNESRDDGYTGGEKIDDAVRPTGTPAPEAAKKPGTDIVGGRPKDERERNEPDRSLSTESRKNSDDDLGVTRSAPAMPKRKQDKAVTRTIDGKSFSQVNGVWTDSAYRGQSTRTVRRSSDEYRTLDSGLRSIADKLPGTVVIVWRDNGYRIE
jgi:hypothetical protein